MASCSGRMNSNLEMKTTSIVETVKIFKFYENVTECHLGENMRWKCRLCESKISSSKRATSNLITHIQRKHPCEFATYQREKESTKVLGEHRIRNLSTTMAAINKYVTMLKYSENDIQQVKLNFALVNMLADNLLPLSFVESDGFQRFMNVADPKYCVPSKKHLANVLIPNQRKHVEETLREALKRTKQICVTLDAYAGESGCSYVAMMAHLVEDWTLKSLLLACRAYDGRHDSENVVREYEDVVELFQIRNKVRHVVTDSALYRVRVAEVNIPLNRAKCELNEADRCLETRPIEINETDLLKQLPERMSCFACALQIVVKDCFRVSRTISDVFCKVSSLMNYFRMSAASDDTLKYYLPVILPEVSDNWNSQLKMVRSFLKIPDTILSGMFNLSDGAKNKYMLSVEERCILSEFLDTMDPFEEAMDQIHGQVVSVSNVVPCIRGLKLSLRSAKVKYCCELVSHLLETVDERLSEYENCDTFILGTVVDPRFKMDWCSRDEVLSLQTILFEEMKNAVARDAKLIDSMQNGHDVSPEDLSKRPKLFHYMSESLTTSFRDQCNDTDERIVHEITHYLSSKCVAHTFDPLLWWKGHVLEFPILASIARNILSVCSSSSMVESILDHNVFDIPRHDITHDQFETLMLIKCNSHLG